MSSHRHVNRALRLVTSLNNADFVCEEAKLRNSAFNKMKISKFVNKLCDLFHSK